jgi:hypothetical protein
MLTNLLKPAKVLAEKRPLLVKDYIMQPKDVHLLTAGDIMTAHPIVVLRIFVQTHDPLLERLAPL